jgi:hypothetical protein
VPNPWDSAAAGVPAADGVGVEACVWGSSEVLGAVGGEVGRSAEVRVGRVGAVAVTLGAGRVPERSVEGPVADSLPPPAPQPLSQRTRPSTSPARSHALVPGAQGCRVPLAGSWSRARSAATSKTSASTTTSGSARAGGGARPACDAGHLRPAVRPRHHPKWVITRLTPGTLRLRGPVTHLGGRVTVHSAWAAPSTAGSFMCFC